MIFVLLFIKVSEFFFKAFFPPLAVHSSERSDDLGPSPKWCWVLDEACLHPTRRIYHQKSLKMGCSATKAKLSENHLPPHCGIS